MSEERLDYAATKIVVRRTVTEYEIYCEIEQPLLPRHQMMEPEVKIRGSQPDILDRYSVKREEILECVGNLKRNFNDLDERQISLVELKGKLIDLRNELTLVQSNFLRSINMSINAIENTRAELMNEKQVNAIEDLLKLTHEGLEDLEVNMLQEILIRSGLNPLPNLEGIAEFY